MPLRNVIAVLVTAAALLPAVIWAQDTPQSAGDVRPLLVGSTIPDAELLTFDDRETTLYKALAESSAAVVFYRGGW